MRSITSSARRAKLGRAGQVLALLVLAPVCAEYLSAYDDSTGHPAQLVVFVPLYGCAALLIRRLPVARGSVGSGCCCWRQRSA